MKIIRAREWLDTKLIVALTIVLVATNSIQNIYDLLFAYLFIFLSLTLGFTVNDYSDYEVDLLSGKDKTLGKKQKKLLVVIIGFLLLFLSLIKGLNFLLLTLVCMGVGLAYSLRPIRFKERGFLGVIVGSLGQRSLVLIPFLVIYCKTYIGVLLLICVTLTGIRTMLIHQVKDFPNDKRQGVATWATINGIEKTNTLTMYVFYFEIFLWLWVLGVISIWLVAIYMILVFWQLWFNKEVNETKSPLSYFYYLVFPLYPVINFSGWLLLLCVVAVLVHQKFFLRSLIRLC